MSRLANFVGFQLCWFACVLGAARESGWLGPLVVLAWCALHLARHPAPAREALALLAVGACGLLVDTLQMHVGWLVYRGTPLGGVLAPAWILALWIAFATTYRSSLAWVARRTWLAALFGAIGAPFSYWAGVRMGAVQFGEPLWSSIAGIAIAWGVAFPSTVALHARLLARRTG